MTGIRTKLGKSYTVKDGKLVKRTYAISRPAQYAKAKKRRFQAVGAQAEPSRKSTDRSA